jgi:hypothetical protein
MRLNTRSSVDLPQPEGPISAVTRFSGNLQIDALQRMELVVVEVQAASGELDRRRRDAGALGSGKVEAGVIHGGRTVEWEIGW